MSIGEELDKNEAPIISNNDRDKGETLQPIPNNIKYGGMVLVVLIILIIIWLSTSSSDESESKQAKALFDVESEVVVKPKEDIEINTNPVKDKDRPIIANLPINTADEILNASKSGSLDASGIPIAKQKDQNQLKLIKLEEQLSQLIIDNNAKQQKQDEKIEELQSQITSQLAKIEQLQANTKARKVAVKTKTRPRPSKRYRRVTPPFTLVSIDQWGDDSYAVVRLQDQLYELTNGQMVGNWRVESIHHDRQMAVFKNKHGTRKELLVNL